ncbi:hypothetical protein ART_3057 [Arthrobacter sp. PAMC 25486]|uniref:hypothetical protein n=1 Tax=Arthrobacter sp. PAMC 25486 TaxID=1494608 RepID=UPI000535E457|nr:hypothetical protein [Arthrobacter sp. PAMC 25486]AIY02656.1 hypothetical protein ART_3057 [Arthrobacter sp. PAMC 25486]
MTEQHTPVTQGTADAGTPAGGTAVVGPLTIRDLAVLGSVLIIFIASLIPLVVTPVGSFNLWNTTNLFYVGIGMVLPLATGALFLIRRFSPGTKLRLGSLSLDQFASVVAVFAVFFFFAGTATDFRVAYLVGLIGAVLFMAATTCASWIPVLAADFAGRAETPSHVIARDAVAPGKRPASPKPVAVKPIVPGAAAGQFGQKATNAADAAGDSAVGQPVGAAAWAGSRPAVAGHTSAGQIFTPAKDGRPSDGAGTDAAATSPATGAAAGTAAGASAGTAGTVGAAGTAAGAGVTGATPATSSATPSSATPAAETSAAGAGSAANTANKAASATNTAEGTANTGGISASGAAHRDPAANSQGVSAQEPATTINPQLAQAPQEAEAVQPAAAQAPAAVAEAAAPAKESIAATVDPKAAAPAVIAEPFWFAVDRPQNVIDENTRQFIYKLTPGSWILALEDRGNSFLVQDGHGKTGVLLDLVGIERASDSQ